MGISEATKQKLEDNLNKALEKETPESWNKFLDEQGEQKPTDKVEPKFHEGDWVFIEEVRGYKNGPFQIKTVDSFGYSFDEYHTIPFMYEELLSKWTIQDTKDGDVLAVDPWSDYPSSFVVIYKKQNEEDFDSYCFVGFDGKFYKGENGHSTEDIHPATKEQRELLFQNMKEAGYEWDAEKKELKKIEQKPAWSEEDEKHIDSLLERLKGLCRNEFIRTRFAVNEDEDWLKSLRPQSHWKPSEEQMQALSIAMQGVNDPLFSLYQDLKKLREK